MKHLLSLIALLCFLSNIQASISYVDQDASGANDGTSWTNAYTDLNDAFLNAAIDSEIWVAEGIYKPTTTTNRDVSFNITTPGLIVLGGFIGTESSRDERDWAAHVTAISGGIGDQTSTLDNTRVLLKATDITGNAVVMDGFHFRRSQSDPDVTAANFGTTQVSFAKIHFKNCTWSLNNQRSGSVLRCYNGESEPMFENCLFRDNHHFQGGSIVDVNAISTVVTINCTAVQNTNDLSYGSVFGGPVTGQHFVYNTIIWDNEFTAFGSAAVTTDHCLIENPNYPPTAIQNNSVYGMPYFLDPTNNDFRLAGAQSAGWNAGEVSLANALLDLDHNDRVKEGAIDLGCYELQNGIIYVDKDATGTNNGKSWANAFNELYDALDATNYGSEIWVAEGTYKPEGTTRSDYFQWPGNTLVYGGFDGTETGRNQRFPKMNLCTLSGDIGVPNDNSDNVYHVIYMDDLNANMHIDGFRVSDGKADGTNDAGAGIYARRCIDLEINDVHCRDNEAEDASAALLIQDMSGTAIIDACSFIGNIAARGIVATNRTATFRNCIFSSNETETIGVFWNSGELSPILENCNFHVNNAPRLVTGDGVTFNNCIVWNNDFGVNNVGDNSFNSCILQVGMTGGTQSESIYEDPLWMNPNSGGFDFYFFSPAFNSGDNSLVTSALDFDGDYRIWSVAVDRGAQEQQDTHAGLIYVNDDAEGNDDGSSWIDAYTNLQDAFADGANKQIWVAKGSYYPTSGTNREVSFEIPSGCQIYGGFNGAETLLEQRDWSTNYTELSGEIGTIAKLDNSQLLLKIFENNRAVKLNGFTIRGAYASDAGNFDNRAAIGIFDAEATFSNCIIMENEANSGPAAFISGGNDTRGVFENCLFHNNSTFNNGIITSNDILEMYNCTMSNNELIAPLAVDISGNAASGEAYLYNSIFWEVNREEFALIVDQENVFNCIASSSQATHNSDPFFVDTGADDYSLQQASPANNGGDNSFVSSLFDLASNERIQNNNVDVGCFEQALAPLQGCIGDLNVDGMINSADLVILLADFACTSNCIGDINGDDQTNSGDLVILLSGYGSVCD